jgi:hypothetical protein
MNEAAPARTPKHRPQRAARFTQPESFVYKNDAGCNPPPGITEDERDAHLDHSEVEEMEPRGFHFLLT